MPKISLSPQSNPFSQVYKYFHDKLNGQLTAGGNVVPFVFSKENKAITYPCVYLEFVRKLPYTSDRYIGDDIKAKNVDTGLYELVTIGEPYETIWTLVVETTTRDTLHEISPQILAIMKRTGMVEDPFYIEHSRDTKSMKFDYYGDNRLMKADSESIRFIEKFGFRTYMRLAGGFRLDSYNPRPPIEQIILDTFMDGTNSYTEDIIDETTE